MSYKWSVTEHDTEHQCTQHLCRFSCCRDKEDEIEDEEDYAAEERPLLSDRQQHSRKHQKQLAPQPQMRATP